MSKILAGQPNQPIPRPDPEFVIGDKDGDDNDHGDDDDHHHKKKKHKHHDDDEDNNDDNSDDDSRPPSGPPLRHLVAPYTVGEQDGQATTTLTQAGYPPRTVPLPSSAPKGQVIGQTPQGNVPKGTAITVYTSSGQPPGPS
jgi:hypothetical protein